MINNIIKSCGNIKDKSIIYDIDDTLIDKNGNPIEDVIETYNLALSKDFTIILITARSKTKESINQTILDLNKCKIFNYKAIYFYDETKGFKTEDNIKKYKLIARYDVYKRGYSTILSIGDMYWDIGEYGGIGFLV
jgi:hydroxymethylpyrimidine pyrophosphatase-like HAD family hydrolase